jgi:hypothetical protein
MQGNVRNAAGSDLSKIELRVEQALVQAEAVTPCERH